MHHRKLLLKGRLSGVALGPRKEAPEPAPAPVMVPKEIAPAPLPALPAPPPVDTSMLRLLMEELNRLVERLRRQHRDASAEIAQAAVELGVAVAERVVHVEIQADRQRLDRIIRDALERMTPTTSVRVRGSADDLALLERQLAEHADLQPHRHLLAFHPEKGAGRGELKLDADEWFVEWDTQRSLAELRGALIDEVFADE